MGKYRYECIHCGLLFKSYNPRPKFCTKKCKDEHGKTPIDVQAMVALYEKGLTQSEVAELLGTTQKVIWSRMKEIGYTPRVAYKRDQYGDNNSSWRGGIVRDRGYILEKCIGHPRAADCGDYVPQHILIMEKHLGRHLVWKGPSDPETEVVHHKNGIRSDNHLDNLQVMTFSEHASLHNELRKQGGGAICQKNVSAS